MTKNVKRALLIVDVQNDFCWRGALPVPGASGVMAPLNRYLRHFSRQGDLILASRDWHPKQSRHFKENGGIWPVHCVRSSRGARFYSKLKLPGGTIVVSKGLRAGDDGYSAFEAMDRRGRPLDIILKKYRITTLYVGGLATDYCVKASVLDALRRGYKVYVIVDAVRGVDAARGDSVKALRAMKVRGALVTRSKKRGQLK